MDHQEHNLTKISELNNENTKTTFYTNNNFEEPIDDTTSAQSYVSYYSRTIRRRRNQREIRKRTNALFPYRRFPVQVTNHLFANHFFNGSTFH